jgi:hypothetical protein
MILTTLISRFIQVFWLPSKLLFDFQVTIFTLLEQDLFSSKVAWFPPGKKDK